MAKETQENNNKAATKWRSCRWRQILVGLILHEQGDTHTNRHTDTRQCGVTSNIFNYETLKVAKLKCNEHESWEVAGGERRRLLVLWSIGVALAMLLT